MQTIRLTNPFDAERATRGEIADTDVRTFTVETLADTGARTLACWL